MSDNGQRGLSINESIGKVVLENVKARNNSPTDTPSLAAKGIGMQLVLSSEGIKLKNVEASGNGDTGISITSSDGSKGAINIVGTTVVRNNKGDGILLNTGDRTSMKVKGTTYIYGNNGDGLTIPDPSTKVDVGGTLYSCHNVGSDVFNNGDGKFDKKGVTCGTQGGSGDLPGCTPAQCTAAESECPAP